MESASRPNGAVARRHNGAAEIGTYSGGRPGAKMRPLFQSTCVTRHTHTRPKEAAKPSRTLRSTCLLGRSISILVVPPLGPDALLSLARPGGTGCGGAVRAVPCSTHLRKSGACAHRIGRVTTESVYHTNAVGFATKSVGLSQQEEQCRGLAHGFRQALIKTSRGALFSACVCRGFEPLPRMHARSSARCFRCAFSWSLLGWPPRPPPERFSET